MTLDQYEACTEETAIYPKDTQLHALSYVGLGLTGEAGEVANKIKKILRGDCTVEQSRAVLSKELGDCLWYLAQAARVLGFSLDEVAQENITKLRKRKEDGTLTGDGDHR